MRTVLIIRSSLFGEDAQSNQLADRVVTRLEQQFGTVRVVERDLGRRPVPHLDAETFEAFGTESAQRTAAQAAAVAASDRLIQELKAADFIVLATPMYNFGVSSALKAWYDQVARAGVTFSYTPEGPRGLLEDRPVYVISTRGGRYAGTDADLQTPYLKQILAFVGLKDVHFVFAEGLASGSRQTALNEAGQAIDALAA